MSKIFAVKRGDEWNIAELIEASRYGGSYENSKRMAWSEVGTTAWICFQGEEERAVQLEPNEAE